MKRIPFVKMSGAGNDFVLVESPWARSSGLSPARLARRLCDRRASVGADGLLVIRRRPGRVPELDYYNADGSRAFCANGSRCAAWRMHRLGWAGRDFSFRTAAGEVSAVIAGRERVRLGMPRAGRVRLGLRLKAAGREWTVHHLDTGVPHAVVAVRGLDAFPVFEVGLALRRHRTFAPAGANVNFIEALPRGNGAVRGPVVRIRTYERGVEDETLACGTGATASALVVHLLLGWKSPVRLLTRGGELLTVSFPPSRDRGRSGFDHVRLEGPAVETFEGAARL